MAKYPIYKELCTYLSSSVVEILNKCSYKNVFTEKVIQDLYAEV